MRAPFAAEIDALRQEEASILVEINEETGDLKLELAYDDY